MRILTGLQPSGKLHVGNYFGAMEPAVHLQEQGEAFYFIADYHAMTSTHDPAALRENVRELAVDFLACGLDPGGQRTGVDPFHGLPDEPVGKVSLL